MRLLTLARAELARITSTRFRRIAFVALATVPLLYAGLYLWGNHDPYGALTRVPAAVVVADAGGTTTDGTAVDYGRDAADSLQKDASFDWTRVTAAEARDGVEQGRFAFAVEFPRTFSADLLSAAASGDAAPTTAKLLLVTDDRNAYLSSTVAGQTANRILAGITAQVGTRATTDLLGSIGEIRSGLTDASSGAAQLASGASTAASGADRVASGSGELASSADRLADGLDTLRSSAAGLPASASQLASGASGVASGASSVASGAATAAGSAQQLADGASRTAAGAAQLQPQLDAAIASNPLLTAEQKAALTQGVAQVASGTAQVRDGAGALSSGVGQLSTGAAQVSSGAGQVASGTAALNRSAPALVSGIGSAASGASELAGGAHTLAEGAGGLDTGAHQVADGAGTLSSSLASATQRIPDSSSTQQQRIAETVATPVALHRDAITEASDYGEGLAPFFVTLATWIGMYALFLILRPLSRAALASGRRPLRTALAGFVVPFGIGAVQMVALTLVLAGPLGYHPAHPVLFVLFALLMMATFAAIIQALNALLGSTGQFLALVFMLVQLVVAGGTFPWQTLPGPLAALHPLLPMTFGVNGFRDLLYGGDPAVAWGPALALAGWLVVALAGTTLAAVRQGRSRSLRQLEANPLGGG